MKINVSKFSETDIISKVAFINDRRINSNIHFNLPGSVSDTLRWYNNIGTSKDRIDFVFKNDEDVTVGMCGLINIDLQHSSTEFYILINPDLHGRGLGKLLTAWTTNYAFLTYNLNKIYLYTDSDNAKALNLYKKLGFVQEGCQRQHRYKDGVFKDKIAFGLLRTEWLFEDWRKSLIEFSFGLPGDLIDVEIFSLLS